ncbi:SWIM zinc finger family protein [Nocardia sp. NPDC024068]|uniref:SWIM zinc finger family protein n=1 Tax=Nocardia sp. NPDC024068 TaxID=3157197 RepID=UPI0033C46981
MTQRWSENQVSALAPDTGSLTAARKLAGKWSGTGWHETALWGLCKGSGSTPYQTIVDLAGPAFRCSCPSRKFPCKHALSLLMLWSAGTVAEAAETADFAAEWLDRRARQAAAPARPPRTGAATPTPQRRERVAAGLAELDIWLADQIRTGLAQTDRSHAAYEAVAARMVDAQAPGIAAALRRLPTAVVLAADWPQIVLGRFAWLHLLIRAHADLDTLPAPLAATVRGHIGYPVPADSVHTEPAVRDRWLTMGTRTREEDRLYTRSSWLYGLDTGRWALILDHSHGTPSFPSRVPPPGLATEADLHFYPGAAPLRAVVGHTPGSESVTKSPSAADLRATGAGTIAAALDDFATAAAADPWLESRPVLLHDVIPARTGADLLVTEPDGAALPLAAAAEPWRLLALSGGRPVTVFGTWTGRRLDVISVLVADEFHDAGPRAEFPETAIEATAEAASVALLGTARGAGGPDLPGPVGAAVAALPETDPAHRLLATAALEIAWSRGGRLPERTEVPADPAAVDPRPLLPGAAADQLALLIETRQDFLPEWFAAARLHDYRAPDRLAGPLLEFAARDAVSRESALRLAGTRGRWLAGRFERWHQLVRRDTAEPEPGEETWRLGADPERLHWLSVRRRQDPAAARIALEEAWPRESGPVKAGLLAVLADGLGAADEELLERALDDRRGDVRRTAAELLAGLPDSAFSARMTARAAAWVKYAGDDAPGPGREMLVDIPATLDEAAARDGFTDSTTEFGYRWEGLPDIAATRLRRLVAALPPACWTEPLGTPDRAVSTRIDDRFRQPLFDGWMDAALAHRDPAWAAALFAAGMPSNLAILRRRELFALIPPDDQLRHLLRLDSSWLSELESLLPAVAQPWPPELARHLLRLFEERARTAARRPGAPGTHPNAHRSLLHTAALHMPPGCAGEVSALAGRRDDEHWTAALGVLAHDLHQRSVMLEELK